MKCVVRCPFAFERFDGPVPNEAVGVLLAHGEEFTLEILLRDFEGGFEVDVRRGDGVVATRGEIPSCGNIPSTSQVTFLPHIVPSPVLQHGSCYILGPFRSLFRAQRLVTNASIPIRCPCLSEGALPGAGYPTLIIATNS